MRRFGGAIEFRGGCKDPDNAGCTPPETATATALCGENTFVAASRYLDLLTTGGA